MSFLDENFTKFNLVLLLLIIILTGTLLAFSWAAQKDMQSLRNAYEDCTYQVSLINRGMLPMFSNNSLIIGEINATETNTRIGKINATETNTR